MLTLLLVFTGSPANAATVERTVTCPENVSGATQYINPGLNLSAVPGDIIRVTFVNCETRKLWGGNGNGMFLNPTAEYQVRAGWRPGSSTWNLPNTSGLGGPVEGTVIEFELMSSANSGTVPFAPSANLMVDFGGAHGPLMWWRMAASVGPTVLPALSPATQTLDAYFGVPISATSAFTQTGLTTPVTYAATPALPAGLTLNTSTGVITGTIAAGTTVAPTYTIRGIAANNQVATSTLSLTASTPPITTPAQVAPTEPLAPTPLSLAQTGFDPGFLVWMFPWLLLIGFSLSQLSSRMKVFKNFTK